MARKNRPTLIALFGAILTTSAYAQTPNSQAIEQWMNRSIEEISSKQTLSSAAQAPSSSESEPSAGSLTALLTSLEKEPTFNSMEDLIRSKGSTLSYSLPSDNLSLREQLKTAALGNLGVPYRYGGNSPESGFDCSGFVVYVFKNFGNYKLPRRSADMGGVGTPIEMHELAIGDLVFFNTLGRRFSHVGIYIGDNEFVHAPSTNGSVRVEQMSEYWVKRYNGARRILSESQT